MYVKAMIPALMTASRAAEAEAVPTNTLYEMSSHWTRQLGGNRALQIQVHCSKPGAQDLLHATHCFCTLIALCQHALVSSGQGHWNAIRIWVCVLGPAHAAPKP